MGTAVPVILRDALFPRMFARPYSLRWLGLLAFVLGCTETAPGVDAGELGPDAFVDPCDPATGDCYPTDPAPLEGDACASDHEGWWQVEVPEACAERRLCIDDR